jgi:hypothetical protein
MLRREVEKTDRVVGEVEKAARSAISKAGWDEMVPRREMRRPAWSEERRRVSLNWGMRDSALEAISGGVVEVMVGCVNEGMARVVRL